MSRSRGLLAAHPIVVRGVTLLFAVLVAALCLAVPTQAFASISVVATSAASGTSVNFSGISGWQAGDMALVYAFRDGSTTAPTLNGSFTNINTGSNNSGPGNTCSGRLAYRILVAGDTTFSFTNATELEVMILRGVAGTPVAQSGTSNGNGNTLSYPSLTAPTSSSWIVGFGGHRSANNVNVASAGTMTRRIPSVSTLGMHTLTGVTSFSSTNWAQVSSSSNWVTINAEIDADATGPTATVASPSGGSAYKSSSVPAVFSGTIADDVSGVDADTVVFSIQRASDNKFWNGVDWLAGARSVATTHTATTGSGSTTWSGNVTMPNWAGEVDGSYTVQARGIDKASNAASPLPLSRSRLTTPCQARRP